MRSLKFGNYFDKLGVKRITSVEIPKGSSNQHELNGVTSFRDMLGTEEIRNIPTRFVWISDSGDRILENGSFSWYDSRSKNPSRSPEWRLYYSSNKVMEKISKGDLFILGSINNSYTIFVVEQNSNLENQILRFFGIQIDNLNSVGQNGNYIETKQIFNSNDLHFESDIQPLLEMMEISFEDPEEEYMDKCISDFVDIYGNKMPSGKNFSKFCRSKIPNRNDFCSIECPDTALHFWMEWEERVFYVCESYLLSDKIKSLSVFYFFRI